MIAVNPKFLELNPDTSKSLDKLNTQSAGRWATGDIFRLAGWPNKPHANMGKNKNLAHTPPPNFRGTARTIPGTPGIRWWILHKQQINRYLQNPPTEY